MKTELTDVSDTRKTIRFEIPSDVVDAEINRVAHGYSRIVADARSARVAPRGGCS
jgi:hypothetical protein